MTPLYSQKDNFLTDLKGNESYFYKINPTDLDQNEDLNFYFNQLNSLLMNEDSKWIKLYKIDEKFFLNTPSEKIISNFDVVSHGDTGIIFHDNYDHFELYDHYFTKGDRYFRILSITKLFEKANFNILRELNYIFHIDKFCS